MWRKYGELPQCRSAFGTGIFLLALLLHRPENLLLLLLLVSYLLPHLLIFSEERFHLTLIPFFSILAAGFWSHGFSVVRSRGRLAVSIDALFAMLLLLNWGLELCGDVHLVAQMLGPQGNQLYLPY